MESQVTVVTVNGKPKGQKHGGNSVLSFTKL